MSDMLVNLYAADLEIDEKRLGDAGVSIRRAGSYDRYTVIEFVRENFANEGNWASECESAFSAVPSNCFVAVKEGKIIGFACIETTTKNYFGPAGVLEAERGRGVGTALLKRSLSCMKEMGYAYAIIGWAAVKAKPMYARVGARDIENWKPQHSIYANMMKIPEEKPVV